MNDVPDITPMQLENIVLAIRDVMYKMSIKDQETVIMFLTDDVEQYREAISIDYYDAL